MTKSVMFNNQSTFKNKKAIIWDWNGTLLNDIDICISCMNTLLDRRNIRPLTREKYKQIFTFPVRDYYEIAGLDVTEEKFEKPALEFIDLYHKSLSKAQLFPDVKQILLNIHNRGYHQSILSAMEHNSLIRSLTENGISQYFQEVSGINNHYAHSKLEIGLLLLEKINFHKDQILLIGDSLHDKEVAESLSIDFLLIANGHQSKERLTTATKYVLDDLEDLLTLLE